MPTARFYDESSYGYTLYNGDPDQKITMTSFPYNWMEASFFYSNIQDKPYPGYPGKDYKDKGFNFKLRLKEEGVFPAIAVGINDIAGTGYYSSEYIVGSYGINNIDFHFGLSWGTLGHSRHSFKNPFGEISSQFYDRPTSIEENGGQFQPSRYFSGEKTSPFVGISYALNSKVLISLETDNTLTPGNIGYEKAKSDISFGIDYSVNNNFIIGIANERNNYISAKFVYKNNPKESIKEYQYKKSKNISPQDDKYKKLIKNIQNNGIGVNKIIESPDAIGLELTQFKHTNLDIIEEIIASASVDSGIKKAIKTDIRIANLQAKNDIDEDFSQNSQILYERKKSRRFNSKILLS